MILHSATYAEVAEDNEATIDAAFLILIYVMAATIPNAMNVSATWLMIRFNHPPGSDRVVGVWWPDLCHR